MEENIYCSEGEGGKTEEIVDSKVKKGADKGREAFSNKTEFGNIRVFVNSSNVIGNELIRERV